jgi:hypothetical protein
MSTRKKKTGESTDAPSGHQGVPGRHHYEYAPSVSKEEGQTDEAGSAQAPRPPEDGAVITRSVKE